MFLKEGEVYFNNLFSQQDLGLRLENYPKIPLSYENYSVESGVYKRKAPLIINEGTFNNKEVSFVFTKEDDEDILNFDEIYSWLFDVKNNKFMYGLEDRCLICKKVAPGDFEQEFRTFGTITIKFILSPFWEDINIKKINVTESGSYFGYLGNVNSEPYISIRGNGNISITLDGETLLVKNVFRGVNIDCENMKILDLNGNSKEFESEGGFFELNKGKHIISYKGNVTKFEFTYKNKWR